VLHMPPPPPPPLQRCCCSKNTLALKGAALAGVATPMRTDHAIRANIIVLMAISPPLKDIVSPPPKRASEPVTRPAPEIGDTAHDLPLILSLLLALDMRISASLLISAQMLHLGVFRRCWLRQAAGSLSAAGDRPGTAQCTAHARQMQSRRRKFHDLQVGGGRRASLKFEAWPWVGLGSPANPSHPNSFSILDGAKQPSTLEHAEAMEPLFAGAPDLCAPRLGDAEHR
jgi:hypothetical protein